MLPQYLDQLSPEQLNNFVAKKTYSIAGSREQWKDYVAVFFLLEHNLYTIEKIVSLAKKKFQGEFNEKLFLQQLTYYDDLKITPTVFLKDSYKNDEIKSFLEKQVEDYLSRILPSK